jgi:phosphatidylinositol alpha-1,6-mannosyltransferase
MLIVAPSLAPIGGVQLAARIAWEGLARRCAERSCQAYLFSYSQRGEAAARDLTEHQACAESKLSALIKAGGRRWPVQSILVWHLGLLKLLPFFRARDARIAVFLHGIEAWRKLDPLTRWLTRRVDLFLTNSEYTWQRFLQLNPECSSFRSRTVHLGAGSPVRGPLSRPSERPAIIMISRLARTEDYKGHREVIAAWPHVRSRVRDAELWIVGDGDLRSELEARARAVGESKTIRFMGSVSEDEKQLLLSQCRGLAMPSRSEGFGLVYIEAMRQGRPCLVSMLDAGREIVRPPEAGLAVDPDNRDELVDGLCRLLLPTGEWDLWSLQARQRYDGAFTAAHFQSRLETALVAAGLLDT